MFKRGANRLRSNFVEGYPENFFRIGRGDFFRGLFSLFFFRQINRLRLPAKTRRAGLLLFKLVRLRQHHCEVRGNRFAFAVRVARQIDRIGGIRRFAQVGDDLALAGNNLERRFENLFVVQRDRLANLLFLYFLRAFLCARLLLRNVVFIGQTDADRLFRQVEHVADRRLHDVILPKILVDGLRLRRRLHNYQRTTHDAVLPRNLPREGPQARAVSFSLPYTRAVKPASGCSLPATEESC